MANLRSRQMVLGLKNLDKEKRLEVLKKTAIFRSSIAAAHQTRKGSMAHLTDDAQELSEEERVLQSILEDQLSRYPQMQIQDLYKLIHQGAMGSEHAVRDFEGARIWLEQELQSLQEGPQEPVIDPISPYGEIVRVNLRPYLHGEGNPESLLNAFVKTANEYRGSAALLLRYWSYARRMTEEGGLPFDKEELNDFLMNMEREGFTAVHHSPDYEEAYRPAYRVVASIYIPELLGGEGNP